MNLNTPVRNNALSVSIVSSPDSQFEVPSSNTQIGETVANLTDLGGSDKIGVVNTSTIDSVPAENVVPTKPIVKSRKRTSLDEFAHRTRMRPEVKAGFKTWLQGQNYAFDNEWEQLFVNYNNRKI